MERKRNNRTFVVLKCPEGQPIFGFALVGNNRTFVVLKFGCFEKNVATVNGNNRTFVVLKYGRLCRICLLAKRNNRTFVVLKFIGAE